MQKKFLSNIFLLLAVNLLIKPFWILGVDRAVQNTVGNEEYGIYANLFAFSMLFVMLLDFGINNYSTTSVAKDHSIVSRQFSSLASLKLIFSLAYFTVTFFAGMAYGFNSRELWLLGIMAFNQVMAFFILYFRSNVSGLQLFRTDALLSVVDRSLMIVFCGLLIWFAIAPVSIETFVYAQSLGYAVSAIICFLVLRPHLSHIRLNFDRAILLQLLKQTYPYALLALIMTLYMRMDSILIKKLLPAGDTENGIYASASRLLEAANMLAAMVSTMLLPLFAKILNQRSELMAMVRTTMSILIAPAILLSVFCSVYRTEIMGMLYEHGSEYSAQVFGILIVSFIPMCTMYIFGTLLTANASLRILNVTALCALVVNLLLNVLLIPVYGAVGAAIAAVSTHSIVAVFNFFFARKVLGLQITLINVVQYVFFALVLILLAYFVHSFGTGLFMAALVCGAAGISFMFILRILDYRSLLQFAASGLKR